jgi:hypothetical protein
MARKVFGGMSLHGCLIILFVKRLNKTTKHGLVAWGGVKIFIVNSIAFEIWGLDVVVFAVSERGGFRGGALYPPVNFPAMSDFYNQYQ